MAKNIIDRTACWKAAIEEVESLKEKGMSPKEIAYDCGIDFCIEPSWDDVIELYFNKNMNGYFFVQEENNS